MGAFGEFVKAQRVKRGITLRKFCVTVNVDPSNWSRIERGIHPPPKSKTVLEKIAQHLNIERDSEEYVTLFDLAAIDYIPKDLIGNQRILDSLPVFFRTLRGEKPKKEELDELIELITDKPTDR